MREASKAEAQDKATTKAPFDSAQGRRKLVNTKKGLTTYYSSCVRAFVIGLYSASGWGEGNSLKPKQPAQKGLWAGIVLAFALWIVMFVYRPFNFWVMLTFSTSLLSAVAFVLARPLFLGRECTAKNALVGLFLAALLYAIFYVGNQFLMAVSRLFPALLPDRAGNIASVYANLGGLSPALVGLLLFFPIGFGEEVFWRGFVQRRLKERWGAGSAFILTTLLYTAVHVPTGNPVLILAALACGLFWGGFYRATGSLVPVLVSHMLWDPFIFVIAPIR